MKVTFFYIPTRDAAEASSLGELVIAHRLAACSNIFPVQSQYPWEGKLQQDDEYVLVLKTIPDLAHEVETLVTRQHSYRIPSILHWEADVNEAYGNWIREQVRR